jgi:hypothetical protein
MIDLHLGLALRHAELALGQIEATDDHRQHIVEIVRDAPGQLADRLHLLHLMQLRFGGGAFGGFLAQALVRFAEFPGAGLHGMFQFRRAHEFVIGLAAGDQPLRDIRPPAP